MAKVVVIKFKSNPKPYYFEAGDTVPEKGQGVIVETTHGIEYGTVLEPEREVPGEAIGAPLKPIIRIATERDEEEIRALRSRRGEAMAICREKIEKHGLEMKLIDCDFTFDGSKVIFTFSAEGRVDFRELVKDLASVFHMRIELRQVGVRDEAKILGGIAPCGRVCCCASCMPDFRKVSIKMAKNQGLSLNPGKISGLCGRLMCCLSYENDYYASVYKQMPKPGSLVDTPEGKGVVVSVNMLKLEVRVKIEREGALIYRDFPLDIIEGKEPAEEPETEGGEPAEEQPGTENVEEGETEETEQTETPETTEQTKRPKQPKGKGDKRKDPPKNRPQGEKDAREGKRPPQGGKKAPYRHGKGGKKPE